jgi:nucleoside-diphosphate-sugar epimerase
MSVLRDKAVPRVVVTGASGFIGSHLVEALSSDGMVIAVDRRVAPSMPAANAENVVFRQVDLSTERLDDLVVGADTVFHLAGVAGVRESWGASFVDYGFTNVIATQRLLDACEQARVRRLVLASSSSIYGPACRPSDEDDMPQPMSPYAVTKLAAEHLCRAHVDRQDSALTVSILRYFTVYGPRQRPGMAISRLLESAFAGKSFMLYGDGSQRREFTFVDDIVTATIAAARAVPAIVNVGGGSSVSMIELIDLAQEVTGRSIRIERRPAHPGDVAATVADLTRAKQILGYRPAVSLRSGLTRQARWLSEWQSTRFALNNS